MTCESYDSVIPTSNLCPSYPNILSHVRCPPYGSKWVAAVSGSRMMLLNESFCAIFVGIASCMNGVNTCMLQHGMVFHCNTINSSAVYTIS